MCGRFATGLLAGQNGTADWLGIERDAPPPDWADAPRPDLAAGIEVRPAGGWPPPSWNVAPTQDAAIVVPGETPDAPRRVVRARWGLVPRWWSKPLAEMKAATFNARAEEAASKPMFRDAWARGRCLVPALGYYEWTGKAGAKRAWFVSAGTNRPGIAFAGLWDRARPGGEEIVSFTILTTAAGEGTRHLHPRSPVVLDEADWQAWLGFADDAAGRLGPIPDGRLRIREVGAEVGNVRNDGAELIEAAGFGL